MSKQTTSKVATTTNKTTNRPTRLGRTRILDVLKQNGNGKIFSITANTKEKTGRVFTGKLTAPKTAVVRRTPRRSNSVPDVAGIGMLRMYDMINKGWRTVNLQEVTQLKCGGVVYNVR